MNYAIVNKITGELDNNCSVCAIGVVPNDELLSVFAIDDNHTILEITDEERAALIASVVDTNNPDRTKDFNTKEEILIPNYTYASKFNPDKIVQRLDDRVKVDVPIEIEGPGGKEIIGFEQKPESIIIKNNTEVLNERTEISYRE